MNILIAIGLIVVGYILGVVSTVVAVILCRNTNDDIGVNNKDRTYYDTDISSGNSTES